jgi:hypothetical protein
MPNFATYIKENEMMLSGNFINSLAHGSLEPLLERVKIDSDLDLQIRKRGRHGYINIYFKGNNLLKLNDNESLSCEMHDKFKPDITIPINLKNIEECNYFIDNYLPIIKEKIITNKAKSKSFEIEYEQLLIRANNYTKKVNSEFFIVDRHFADAKEADTKENIVDLLGIFCDRRGRQGEIITVEPFFGEVKYSLNPDIKNIAQQIDRYYRKITESSQSYDKFINRIEELLHIKSELGLLEANEGLIDKFKKATVDNNRENLMIIIILIDYNPYSQLYNEEVKARLKGLPFYKNIYVLNTGLAMWQDKNVKKIVDSTF